MVEISEELYQKRLNWVKERFETDTYRTLIDYNANGSIAKRTYQFRVDDYWVDFTSLDAFLMNELHFQKKKRRKEDDEDSGDLSTGLDDDWGLDL